MVELLEQATRRLQTTGSPSPRLRRANWRPPLLLEQPTLGTLQRVLLARPALRSVLLARAFFAPGRQL
jgi:hypothetical protein